MPSITRRPNALGFIASFPHQTTESGTDTLYVDGVAGANAWTPQGASPYLDAVDDINRIETNTDNAVSYEFTFADATFPAGADIDSVWLRILALQVGTLETIDIELWDGASWQVVATRTPVTGEYTWISESVLSILSTRTKINAAKVRFTYHKSGAAGLVKIDCAKIEVSWHRTPAHYELVKEDTPDGDITSIWTSEEDSMTYSELYNIPNISLPEGAVIDQIEVFNHAKASIVYGEAYPQLCIFMRTHDTNYASPPIQLTSNEYGDESYVWTTNPFTGQPWTEAEINVIQIGCRANSIWLFAEVFNAAHVTQVFVRITFHVPGVMKTQYGDGLVCVRVG